MIYIIHKIFRILNSFWRSIIAIIKKKKCFLQHIMLESSSLEEEIIIKDVKDLFRLKKETPQKDDTTIWDTRTLFRLKKENKVLKHRILRC